MSYPVIASRASITALSADSLIHAALMDLLDDEPPAEVRVNVCNGGTLTHNLNIRLGCCNACGWTVCLVTAFLHVKVFLGMQQ